MIDRTMVDLRIAAHKTATARVNSQEWQRQGRATRSPLRRAAAILLMTLAARLDPTTLIARRDAPVLPAPARA